MFRLVIDKDFESFLVFDEVQILRGTFNRFPDCFVQAF